MPLELLLILVIGGIAGIALLLHLSGRSEQMIMSHEGARAEWVRHFPDDMVTDVLVARDGHAALIRSSQGPGLVWSFGADTVARHLRDFDVIDAGTHLDIAFHDYTAPRVRLKLGEDERAEWRRWMEQP